MSQIYFIKSTLWPKLLFGLFFLVKNERIEIEIISFIIQEIK